MFFYVYIGMIITAITCMTIVSLEKDHLEEKKKADKNCP